MTKKLNIVVTGGAGMIGSNLVARLLQDEHDVTVIDNFWRGSVENLEYTCGHDYSKVKLVVADLSAPGDWHRHFKDVDCVYHLADIVAGIGFVFSNEGFLFRKNLLINSMVSQVVSSCGASRYIYVGTACSFPKELQSDVNAMPLVETDQFPASPESAYGWSKLMGELDAGYLAAESEMDVVILSLHNVYGSPCDYKSQRSQVIPALVYRALQSKDGMLSIWGDGTQGRAFLHVKDVINGLVAGLEHGHNAGTIQLGPSICTRISELAETIRELVNPEMTLKYDVTKPTGDHGRCANYSKARELLGWEPTVTLKEGLADVIEYVAYSERSATSGKSRAAKGV